jgi:hypothetical protein
VEITGAWRKSCNEELHNLYSSPEIIRVTTEYERGGTYSTYGDLTNVYNILVGRSEWRDYFGHLAAHGRKIVDCQE